MARVCPHGSRMTDETSRTRDGHRKASCSQTAHQAVACPPSWQSTISGFSGSREVDHQKVTEDEPASPWPEADASVGGAEAARSEASPKGRVKDETSELTTGPTGCSVRAWTAHSGKKGSLPSEFSVRGQGTG